MKSLGGKFLKIYEENEEIIMLIGGLVFNLRIVALDLFMYKNQVHILQIDVTVFSHSSGLNNFDPSGARLSQINCTPFGLLHV